MKQYGVILADPPWQYNNTGTEGAAEGQYQTMPLSDICALPVSDIAAYDSVLLLWVTWPMLIEGTKVMEAWGFDYVTGFPYIKITSVGKTLFGDIEISVPYGVGFWVRGCSEFVIIGRKGRPKNFTRDFIGIISPNVYHSRKPDNIYEFGEAFPGPYLEMFARRSRPEWDVWGNEVKSTISGLPSNFCINAD